MIHFLASHWLLLSGSGLGLLAFLFPAVSLPILRWLIGTEMGRYLLVATVVAVSFLQYRTNLIARVRADCMAEQAAATDRARADAAQQVVSRDKSAEAIGDKTQADTAARIDSGQQATQAAQERTHDRIAQVPATGGCAGPDADIVRDVQASDDRLRAAADRMRRVGAAPAGR